MMETDKKDEMGTAVQPKEKKVLIIALGGGGANTLNALAVLSKNSCETLLLETDKHTAESCNATHVLRTEADRGADRGQGCGGDPMKGERAFSRERDEITKYITGKDFVIVTGGLGGGTATGGVRTLASILKSMDIPSVFIVTTPFSFESYTKHTCAAQYLRELRVVTDVLITLPNDLLFSMLPPNAPVETAFCQASAELAASVFGIAELFRSRKLIGPDYAEFSALLKQGANTCCFGCGHANTNDGLDRCSIALERLLESPFLGGMDKLNKCASLLAVMTGGPDLQISEMKRTLENLVSLLPAGIQVSTGVTINPEYQGKVQIAALAVMYEQQSESNHPEHTQETLWAAISGKGKEDTGTFTQGTLNLSSYNKGIFTNHPPVKYKDEDLDIPTFQRRSIVIDKGTITK